MHNTFGIEDSGERQEFSTGAVRDTSTRKPRPDLISPFFMERLGEHLRKGALKYTEWNWAKGIPSSRCYESAMRHLLQFAQGLTNEDHLSAAAFNIMVIIHNQEVQRRAAMLVPNDNRGMCDMPKFYTPPELTPASASIEKEDYAE
jgi:hypothetical protein